MLPSFYQSCLRAQLSETQFVTLEILVELLQKERRISLERLATLFPQPILFESRRRNLQRFLHLPRLTSQAVWFPVVKHWVKQHHRRGKPLHVVIDRTQWQDHNLIMVSLVYQKRAIPMHWMWLNKQGQSAFAEQRKVLRPVFQLLKSMTSSCSETVSFIVLNSLPGALRNEWNLSFVYRKAPRSNPLTVVSLLASTTCHNRLELQNSICKFK